MAALQHWERPRSLSGLDAPRRPYRSDRRAARNDAGYLGQLGVRRAAAAMENGNIQRAVDILDAASQAFPNN